MSKCHVFNEILIYGAGLITCYPAPVDEFKPAISHQRPHLRFNVFVLAVPPSLEKPDLSVGKTRIRHPPQIVCDISKNSIYSSVIILQGGASPTSILMRVSHDMQSLLFRLLLQKLILCTFPIRRECQPGTDSQHGD